MIRQMPRRDPRMAPCFSTEPMKYLLHDGSKRHCRPTIGLKKNWYSRTMPMRNWLGTLPIDFRIAGDRLMIGFGPNARRLGGPVRAAIVSGPAIPGGPPGGARRPDRSPRAIAAASAETLLATDASSGSGPPQGPPFLTPRGPAVDAAGRYRPRRPAMPGPRPSNAGGMPAGNPPVGEYDSKAENVDP